MDTSNPGPLLMLGGGVLDGLGSILELAGRRCERREHGLASGCSG